MSFFALFSNRVVSPSVVEAALAQNGTADLRDLAHPDFDLRLQDSLLTESSVQADEFRWISRPSGAFGKLWCWLRHGSQTRSDLVCDQIKLRLLRGDYSEFNAQDFDQLERNLQRLRYKLGHKKGEDGLDQYTKAALDGADAIVAGKKGYFGQGQGLRTDGDRLLQSAARQFDVDLFKVDFQDGNTAQQFFRNHLIKASFRERVEHKDKEAAGYTSDKTFQCQEGKPRAGLSRVWCRMRHGQVFRKDRLAEVIALRVKHGDYTNFSVEDYDRAILNINGSGGDNIVTGIRQKLNKNERQAPIAMFSAFFDSEERTYVNKALDEAIVFLEAKKDAKIAADAAAAAAAAPPIAQVIEEAVQEQAEGLQEFAENLASPFIQVGRNFVDAAKQALHDRDILYSEELDVPKDPQNEYLAEIQEKAHRPEHAPAPGSFEDMKQKGHKFNVDHPDGLPQAEDPVPPSVAPSKSLLDSLLGSSFEQAESPGKAGRASSGIFDALPFFGKAELVDTEEKVDGVSEGFFSRLPSLPNLFEKTEPVEEEEVEPIQEVGFSLPSVPSLPSFGFFSGDPPKEEPIPVVASEPVISDQFEEIPRTLEAAEAALQKARTSLAGIKKNVGISEFFNADELDSALKEQRWLEETWIPQLEQIVRDLTLVDGNDQEEGVIELQQLDPIEETPASQDTGSLYSRLPSWWYS